MSKSFQFSAEREAYRVGRSARRTGMRILGALTVTVLLMIPASVPARESNQIQLQAVPPDVQITQVKVLPFRPGNSATDVEIRWTAQVPRLTTLDEFDVLLDVRYSDGSRSSARTQQLKSTARSAILSLATHPHQNANAVLKDFKASVSARFRVASSVAVVHQVSLSQSDSVHRTSGSSGGSSVGRQPEVVVIAAKLVTEGCPNGYQCVDLKWTAAAPRNVTINDFTANVEVLHKDGTQTTDSKTVGGQDRQTRLQAGRANVEVNSMKVSLLTSFSLLDSKTAVREGTFSIDSLRG